MAPRMSDSAVMQAHVAPAVVGLRIHWVVNNWPLVCAGKSWRADVGEVEDKDKDTMYSVRVFQSAPCPVPALNLIRVQVGSRRLGTTIRLTTHWHRQGSTHPCQGTLATLLTATTWALAAV